VIVVDLKSGVCNTEFNGQRVAGNLEFRIDLKSSILDKEAAMPKYVIEREIPGAGNLSADELQAISQKSCGVLRQMGPQIQWVESFVTQDKVYCIYVAPDAEAVRQHAQQGGFPVNRISEVKRVIDPTTAE
jgi:hypothetical protein